MLLFLYEKSLMFVVEFGWSKVVYCFCIFIKELFCNLLVGFCF